MKAIIVDIDGTVALKDGARGPYEYDKVHLDKPNRNVVELVKKLSNGYDVYFLSGREETCRPETMAWLDRHVIWVHPDRLLMRAAKDYRDDTIVKRELYEKHIQPYRDVLFVLDDRDKVVAMWRELGLTCLQVAPGPF